MPILRYFCYFACILFAACGGSNGGSSESRGTGVAPRPSSCGGHLPISGSYAFHLRNVDEVEPNDDISTAFALDMPVPAASEDLGGIIVQGSVDDTVDRVDTFSITPARQRWLFIKLCGSSCAHGSQNDLNGDPDSLPVWIAHFNVLDADGRLVATSAARNLVENYEEVCLDSGVIYYISVHAFETNGLAHPYQISVFERDY